MKYLGEIGGLEKMFGQIFLTIFLCYGFHLKLVQYIILLQKGAVYNIVTEDDINISEEIFEKVVEKCKELKEKKKEKSDEQ